MRIARIELEGSPVTALADGDSVRPLPGIDVLDLLTASSEEREQRAEHASVGYLISNGWSGRAIAAQEARLPFGFHKTKDFANTFGPWIVTPDELGPYRESDRLNLRMTAYVNGSEIGGDTLASMAWSFPELVHFAARGAWIAPGDVI